MYSAGLNNYLRFASGDGFREIHCGIELMDTPIPLEEAIRDERTVWRRSEIIRIQAIELASYSCEINHSHQSFVSESTNKPYMEGHHAIPMNAQDHFNVSLDVYANIVCLCPICHRRIHYGIRDERVGMIQQIYDKRFARLARSGLAMSKDEFVDIAAG